MAHWYRAGAPPKGGLLQRTGCDGAREMAVPYSRNSDVCRVVSCRVTKKLSVEKFGTGEAFQLAMSRSHPVLWRRPPFGGAPALYQCEKGAPPTGGRKRANFSRSWSNFECLFKKKLPLTRHDEVWVADAAARHKLVLRWTITVRLNHSSNGLDILTASRLHKL